MNRKQQLSELDALQSIFYSNEFEVIKNKENEDIEALFWGYIALPEDYTVKYKESLETDEYSCIKVKHLPPVKLHLVLPEAYPSKCSPNFTIHCQWLTRILISKLCKQLDKIWCDNMNTEVIYMWIDFIKNDLLNFLGCETQLDFTELYSIHLEYLKNLYSSKGMHKTEAQIPNEKSAPSKSIGTDNKPDNSQKQSNFYFKKSDLRPYYYNRNIRCDSNSEAFLDRRGKLNLDFKSSPIKLLINYNVERENIEFQARTFTCNICFMDKLGKECTKFDECNHVFCRNCICGYFTVQIDQGMVQAMKCPEIKCTSEASPSQVRDIVSEELFARYDSLLLNSALDSMGNTVYCPRNFCQYPVTFDENESLVICPQCQYVFCRFCKRVYHGIESCTFKAAERKKLLDEYMYSSSEVKRKMELCYGKKSLETLLNNFMTETWIESNCKLCPHCKVSIEKSQGCNKMICRKCNTYFCWLCSTILDPSHPYVHYFDTNSPCAKKLFYLTPLGDEELDDYNNDDEEWYDWDWI